MKQIAEMLIASMIETSSVRQPPPGCLEGTDWAPGSSLLEKSAEE
jgi:hypothetical protein